MKGFLQMLAGGAMMSVATWLNPYNYSLWAFADLALGLTGGWLMLAGWRRPD